MKEFLPELALLAACASTHPTVPQPRQNTIDPTPAIQLLRTLRFAGAEAKAPEILGKEPANAQANAVAAIAAYQRTMHQLVQDVLTTANPASPVQPVASPISDHRLISALGMAGTYAALGTWMWFAWYADKPKLEAWRFGGDGWFGVNTYAGGADKLGHVWSNLAMSRLGTELLRKGGWGPWSSSLISAGLCLSAFLFVEVNDGYYTEFSPADMAGNVLGAALATAMGAWPALDDAFDFRMQWYPSAEYRRHPSPNVAEDYSGQTYLLAYKPRSIAAIREGHGALWLLQFINPVLGFESRDYKPVPENPAEARPRQTVLFGFTIDLQAVIDATLANRPSRAARWSHAAGHALTEVFNLPFTTLPVMSLSRHPRQLAGHHRDPRGAFSSARRWRRLSHTAGSRKTQGQTSCWGSALDDKGRCHSLPVSRGCRVVAGRPKGRPAVGG